MGGCHSCRATLRTEPWGSVLCPTLPLSPSLGPVSPEYNRAANKCREQRVQSLCSTPTALSGSHTMIWKAVATVECILYAVSPRHEFPHTPNRPLSRRHQCAAVPASQKRAETGKSVTHLYPNRICPKPSCCTLSLPSRASSVLSPCREATTCRIHSGMEEGRILLKALPVAGHRGVFVLHLWSVQYS